MVLLVTINLAFLANWGICLRFDLLSCRFLELVFLCSSMKVAMFLSLREISMLLSLALVFVRQVSVHY